MLAHSFCRRITSSLTLIVFLAGTMCPPALAQPVSELPEPGVKVELSKEFTPCLLKGVTIDPINPLAFDFLIDKGQEGAVESKNKQEEYNKLIKYFLAALTIPEEDMWVNLSPYEEDRIISESFGQTEMGRDLLSQDYLLKQITASLVTPGQEFGKEFWEKVYAKVFELYGTTDIPVSTFNKVWIVPDEATVYESGQTVFVMSSRLAVMLEEDYLALEVNKDSEKFGTRMLEAEKVEALSAASSEIVREVIIPALEEEINTGTHFALLRQIYQSMILATWYKKALKESLLGRIYVDKSKIRGVDLTDKKMKDKIYDQYLEAFRTGISEFIQEDYDPHMKKTLPRRYYTGGFSMGRLGERINVQTGKKEVYVQTFSDTALRSLTAAELAALPAADFKSLSQEIDRYENEALSNIENVSIRLTEADSPEALIMRDRAMLTKDLKQSIGRVTKSFEEEYEGIVGEQKNYRVPPGIAQIMEMPTASPALAARSLGEVMNLWNKELRRYPTEEREKLEPFKAFLEEEIAVIDQLARRLERGPVQGVIDPVRLNETKKSFTTILKKYQTTRLQVNSGLEVYVYNESDSIASLQEAPDMAEAVKIARDRLTLWEMRLSGQSVKDVKVVAPVIDQLREKIAELIEPEDGVDRAMLTERADVRELLFDVVQDTAQDGQITFRSAVSGPEQLSEKYSPLEVKAVVNSLAENALDAAEGRPIVVTLERSEAGTMLEIRNPGEVKNRELRQLAEAKAREGLLFAAGDGTLSVAFAPGFEPDDPGARALTIQDVRRIKSSLLPTVGFLTTKGSRKRGMGMYFTRHFVERIWGGEVSLESADNETVATIFLDDYRVGFTPDFKTPEEKDSYVRDVVQRFQQETGAGEDIWQDPAFKNVEFAVLEDKAGEPLGFFTYKEFGEESYQIAHTHTFPEHQNRNVSDRIARSLVRRLERQSLASNRMTVTAPMVTERAAQDTFDRMFGGNVIDLTKDRIFLDDRPVPIRAQARDLAMLSKPAELFGRLDDLAGLDRDTFQNLQRFEQNHITIREPLSEDPNRRFYYDGFVPIEGAPVGLPVNKREIIRDVKAGLLNVSEDGTVRSANNDPAGHQKHVARQRTEQRDLFLSVNPEERRFFESSELGGSGWFLNKPETLEAIEKGIVAVDQSGNPNVVGQRPVELVEYVNKKRSDLLQKIQAATDGGKSLFVEMTRRLESVRPNIYEASAGIRKGAGRIDGQGRFELIGQTEDEFRSDVLAGRRGQVEYFISRNFELENQITVWGLNWNEKLGTLTYQEALAAVAQGGVSVNSRGTLRAISPLTMNELRGQIDRQIVSSGAAQYNSVFEQVTALKNQRLAQGYQAVFFDDLSAQEKQRSVEELKAKFAVEKADIADLRGIDFERDRVAVLRDKDGKILSFYTYRTPQQSDMYEAGVLYAFKDSRERGAGRHLAWTLVDRLRREAQETGRKGFYDEDSSTAGLVLMRDLFDREGITERGSVVRLSDAGEDGFRVVFSEHAPLSPTPPPVFVSPEAPKRVEAQVQISRALDTVFDNVRSEDLRRVTDDRRLVIEDQAMLTNIQIPQVEQTISDLQDKIKQVGFENVPEISLRAVSQEFYKTDPANPFGAIPDAMGAGERVDMIPIAPKVFLEQQARKLGVKLVELSDQNRDIIAEEFFERLYNTFTATLPTFAGTVRSKEDLTQSPVYVAFKGFQFDNVNPQTVSSEDIRVDFSSPLQAISTKVDASILNWYANTFQMKDRVKLSNEAFSVFLSQEELERIVEETDAYLESQIRPLVERQGQDWGESKETYSERVLNRYVPFYLYAKFLNKIFGDLLASAPTQYSKADETPEVEERQFEEVVLPASKKEDRAQLGESAPGGIDLNAALLNLQIKRDGIGVPLPLDMQDLEGINIDGFVPVIMDITPVTALPFSISKK